MRFHSRLLIAVLAVAAPAQPARAQLGIPAGQQAAIVAELGKVAAPAGPGCVVAVKRLGAEPFFAAIGQASIEFGVPIDAATPFDIASNSKQFAAAVIFQLEREGRLRLTDEIQQHLPDFPRYAAPITLYHLLHHTSGLRDVDSLRMLSRTEDEPTVTTEDVEAVLLRQRGLDFQPGTRFAYSNSNYILLARIAERLDGKPYPDLLRQRLFAPLGMDHTWQRASAFEVVANKATPYIMAEDGARLAPSNWTVYGTGFVHSNAGDMLKWLEALTAPAGMLREIGPRLLAPGQLRDGTPLAYAAGLVSDSYRGIPRYFHNGGSGGFRSTVRLYPSQRLATAILCNNGSILPNHLSDRVADILLTKFAAAAPAPVRPGPIPSGLYHSPTLDAYRWLAPAEGGILVKTTLSDQGRVYVAAGRDTFVEPVSSARLLVEAAGARIRLDDNLRHFSSFVPIASAAMPGGAVQLGQYRSDEIDLRIAIARDGEGPYIAIAPSEQFMRASDTIERRLQQLPDGAWVSSNGWVLRFDGAGNAAISIGRLHRFPLRRVEDGR